MSENNEAELASKQLSMCFQADEVKNLPDTEVPMAYDVRAFQPGDESSWAKTLNLCGFTTWDVEKVRQYLEEPERLEGSILVVYLGEVIAATFASRASNRGKPSSPLSDDPSHEGVVDYVVTHPKHQGQGLGRATIARVTKFLVDRGCKIVSLTTDEWRLPAIHIYLSLGFKPVMNGKKMPARWETVFNKLKEHGHEYP